MVASDESLCEKLLFSCSFQVLPLSLHVIWFLTCSYGQSAAFPWQQCVAVEQHGGGGRLRPLARRADVPHSSGQRHAAAHLLRPAAQPDTAGVFTQHLISLHVHTLWQALWIRSALALSFCFYITRHTSGETSVGTNKYKFSMISNSISESKIRWNSLWKSWKLWVWDVVWEWQESSPTQSDRL